MKLFNNFPCVACRTFAFLSIFLIGVLSVIEIQYLKKEKENEALINNVILLKKFNAESNYKFLSYISANWISYDNEKIISICTLTGYVTIEKLHPKEDIRYKIVGIEEIASMFGFVKFKIQIPKTQEITYLQINKIFEIGDVISISYYPPVDDCKSGLCIENYKLDSRPPLVFPEDEY